MRVRLLVVTILLMALVGSLPSLLNGQVALSASSAAEADPHVAHKSASPELVQSLLPSGIPALPIAADGSKDPDSIPVALAYRHLIRFLAVPDANPPTDLLARRDHQLRQIGFSKLDNAAAALALRGVREQLDSIEEERKSIDTAAADALHFSELMTRERDLLDSAGERLRSALSVGGAARLDKHVYEHVRRRIVIYGALPQ